MKPTEQLAILTALKKAVDSRIKEVRAVADEEILDAYDDFGVEKIALKLEDQKVGDFIITFTSEGFEITDNDALSEFALDYGLGCYIDQIDDSKYNEVISYLREFAPQYIKRKVALYDGWEKYIYFVDGECVYKDSGMVVPGLEHKPRKIKSTMVRGCKPEDVLPITRRLGGVDQLLLEGE